MRYICLLVNCVCSELIVEKVRINVNNISHCMNTKWTFWMKPCFLYKLNTKTKVFPLLKRVFVQDVVCHKAVLKLLKCSVALNEWWDNFFFHTPHVHRYFKDTLVNLFCVLKNVFKIEIKVFQCIYVYCLSLKPRCIRQTGLIW